MLDACKIAAVIVHVQVAFLLLGRPKVRLAGLVGAVDAVGKRHQLVGLALAKTVGENLIHRTVFDPVGRLKVRLVDGQLPVCAVGPAQHTLAARIAVDAAEVGVQVKMVKVQARRAGGDGKGKVVLLRRLARKLHAVVYGVLVVLGQHQVRVHIAQRFRHREPERDGLPRRHRTKRRFVGGVQAVKISVRHEFPHFRAVAGGNVWHRPAGGWTPSAPTNPR